jgi:hypothetical protein
MRYGEPWKVARERSRVMGDDEWRPWFAWYPVRLEDGTKAWREIVEYHQPMKYNPPRYRVAK